VAATPAALMEQPLLPGFPPFDAHQHKAQNSVPALLRHTEKKETSSLFIYDHH
jgi:hypothetical protein